MRNRRRTRTTSTATATATMARTGVAVVSAVTVALALSGCGGGDGDDGRTAMEAANSLAGQIDAIEETTEITEDNDPNDLIGRSGGYESAAVLTDSRLDEACTSLGSDCGATIEQFASQDEAEERSDYVQTVLQGGGALFGTEYHYIDGDLLLRVWGDLKPSEAQEYETAFSQ